MTLRDGEKEKRGRQRVYYHPLSNSSLLTNERANTKTHFQNVRRGKEKASSLRGVFHTKVLFFPFLFLTYKNTHKQTASTPHTPTRIRTHPRTNWAGEGRCHTHRPPPPSASPHSGRENERFQRGFASMEKEKERDASNSRLLQRSTPAAVRRVSAGHRTDPPPISALEELPF